MAEQSLQGKKIAFLVSAEGIERVELTSPWEAMEKSGATPQLLSAETGTVQTFNHLDKADTFTVDQAVSEAKKLWRRIRLDKPLSHKESRSTISASDQVPGSPGASPSTGASPSVSPTQAEQRLENGLCA